MGPIRPCECICSWFLKKCEALPRPEPRAVRESPLMFKYRAGTARMAVTRKTIINTRWNLRVAIIHTRPKERSACSHILKCESLKKSWGACTQPRGFSPGACSRVDKQPHSQVQTWLCSHVWLHTQALLYTATQPTGQANLRGPTINRQLIAYGLCCRAAGAASARPCKPNGRWAPGPIGAGPYGRGC